MRTLGLFIAVIWLSGGTLAQDFQTGYILLNNGDTLTGEIYYGSGAINPKKITFRTSAGTSVYEVKDVKWFSIQEGEQFYRFNINYREAAADLASATELFEGKLVSSEEWLKSIYHGKYSLYQLTTAKRKYFFTQKDTGAIQELVFRVRLSNGQLQTDDRFKQLLASFGAEMNLNEVLLPLIEKAEYEQDDLTKIYELLNGGKGSIHTKKKLRGKFDISAAGTYYTFTASGISFFDGSGDYVFYKTKFKSSFGYKIGVGYTSFSQHNNGRIQARFGLDLGSISYDGSNSGGGSFQKESYSGRFFVLEPTFSVLFVFNSKSPIKMGLAPFLGYNFILSYDSEGRFENPGDVVTRENFPAASGEFLDFGLKFIGQKKSMRAFIAVSRSSNMFNSALAVMNNLGLSLGFNYFLN